jgi:hypothetical protein
VQRTYRLATGLLLLVLSASTARAESRTFGLIWGADFATLSPSAPGGSETLTMRPGTVVGFYGVVPILKSVSFEPELLYVPKYTQRTVGSTITDLRIKYVEVPLLAKMPMFWGVYVTEGVSLGFAVDMRGVAANLSQITSPDVAIVIGGGHDIGKRVAIDFRYEGGLRRAVNLDTVAAQRTRAYSVIAKLHF